MGVCTGNRLFVEAGAPERVTPEAAVAAWHANYATMDAGACASGRHHPHAGGGGDRQRPAGAGTGRRHRPREEREVDRGQAQALLDPPDITTTRGLRARAVIAVLLGDSHRTAREHAGAVGVVTGRSVLGWCASAQQPPQPQVQACDPVG
jgi:hypothetical protein